MIRRFPIVKKPELDHVVMHNMFIVLITKVIIESKHLDRKDNHCEHCAESLFSTHSVLSDVGNYKKKSP